MQVLVFRRRSVPLLDRKEFKFVDQHRVWPDLLTFGALSICKPRRNEDLPLSSYGHELQDFPQPSDNMGRRDFDSRWVTVRVRAFELRPTDQRASVIYFDSIVDGRFFSVRILNNLVLQAARQNYYALL